MSAIPWWRLATRTRPIPASRMVGRAAWWMRCASCAEGAVRSVIVALILNVQRLVHDAISGAIRTRYGVAEVPPFSIEVPPNRSLGDLAVAVAFQLARTLRKAP